MPRVLIAGGVFLLDVSSLEIENVVLYIVCHQTGAQVVLVALKRGYEVTAIVSSRREAKCARLGLAQRLNELELHNLSLVIIPFITYNDGLNVLLKSATFEAIIFTSIPFDTNVWVHPWTRIALAQQPTLQSVVTEQVGLLQNVLSLVQRSAPSVKRFVLTSSLSAILPMEGGPFPNVVCPGNGYTESDWNPVRVA